MNGPRTGQERQGVRSAVAGGGDPLKIIREEPGCSDPTDRSALFYSPIRDVHPVAWTPAAVAAGQRRQLRSHVDLIDLFQRGLLVSAALDGPVNAGLGSLRAARAIVNCPVMFTDESGEED